MDKKEDSNSVNEEELMQYYGFTGNFGKFQLKTKLLSTTLLHSLAYKSLHPGFAIFMQKARGVKIGKSCYIGPYVQLDLMYPHLIEIGDNVTIATNTMIFAHYNPTANALLKEHEYPREVKKVIISDGAVIGPGSIITAGTTVGKNSIIGAGSVVSNDNPDFSVVVGNPARVIKKIEF